MALRKHKENIGQSLEKNIPPAASDPVESSRMITVTFELGIPLDLPQLAMQVGRSIFPSDFLGPEKKYGDGPNCCDSPFKVLHIFSY